MRPTFRTDLTCSREEQQGVVFYRIDDPATKTSFRLYEIEYLIAQKLDGTRTLAEVISAVKDEYNFDISEADLKKFITQLESMGFISGGDGSGSSMGHTSGPEDGLDWGGSTDSSAVQAMPLPGGSDLGPPLTANPDLLSEVFSGVDEGGNRSEYLRLMKSALVHVKQGYLVHARDYLLAARQLGIGADDINAMIEHLATVGETAAPAQIAFLWKHATELFPDICEQVEPLVNQHGDSGVAAGVTASVRRSANAWAKDFRVRVKLTLLLLAIVLVGAVGLLWAASYFGVFESEARVKVQPLVAERVPIYFQATVDSVKPLSEAQLQFGASGTVAEVLVKAGDRVAVGQTLATLDMPAKIKKAVDAAKKAAQKAQANYDKTHAKLTSLRRDLDAAKSELANADQMQKTLRPKLSQDQDGSTKRDFEKWKKAAVKAGKQVVLLSKKERAPAAADAKAKKLLDSAQQKYEAALQRTAGKVLRAPAAGAVVDVKLQAGKSIQATDVVMFIRDASHVRVAFSLVEAAALPATVQQGSEIEIVVGPAKPTLAKVVAVKPASGDAAKSGVEVQMADPAGVLASSDPAAFRLVREWVETAFKVPTSAVLRHPDSKSYVLVSVDKRALRRDVDVLHEEAGHAVIRDPEQTLRNDLPVVVARLDENETLDTIVDGAFLQAEE